MYNNLQNSTEFSSMVKHFRCRILNMHMIGSGRMGAKRFSSRCLVLYALNAPFFELALYSHWKRMDSINVVFYMYKYEWTHIGMVYNLVAVSIKWAKHSFTIFVQFSKKFKTKAIQSFLFIWISFRLPYYERNFI